MQRTILLLLLTIYTLNVQGQEIEEHSTKEYSIQYPEDWTFDSSGLMNTTFILYSKPELQDTFRENVNLMIQDLTDMNLDLNGYTKLSVDQIKGIKDSEIFESKELKKDGMAYHQIVWKGFVSGRKLKFKQQYFIKDNKAYLVTLTCAESTYDTYVKTGTIILNSFTLK